MTFTCLKFNTRGQPDGSQLVGHRLLQTRWAVRLSGRISPVFAPILPLKAAAIRVECGVPPDRLGKVPAERPVFLRHVPKQSQER